MDLSASLKTRLSGISLSTVVKNSGEREKQRLISDVAFLNQEQYEFLEERTQKKFYTFVQKYWGEKLIDANITCKTFNGEVINVDPTSIRVIDKRWKGASHCLCGKAIRYEYWIKTYGPIGSVHICDHTNLDKTLVADLTKGYKKENELRTDIVRMLADLQEAGESYETWVVSYNLLQKMINIGFVGNAEQRELIIKLCQLNLPLPENLRTTLNFANRKAEIAAQEASSPVEEEAPVSIVEEAPIAIPTSDSTTSSNVHSEFLIEIDKAMEDYRTSNKQGVSGSQLSVLSNLRKAIEKGSPSSAQLAYAKTIVSSLQSATAKAMEPGMLAAQQAAKQVLALIYNHAPHNPFVKSLYIASQNGDLTSKQLDCIFERQLGKGRTGLYYQFASIMNENKIVIISPKSYNPSSVKSA
jgi:hypothetical protein